MILDTITKLKRQSALTAMLLMCLGVMLLLCPEQYVSSLIMVAGYIMIVYALEQSLEFIVNNTSIMSYIWFITAIIVGLVGLAVLVFHEDVLNVLCWIFGVLLIVEGRPQGLVDSGDSCRHSDFLRRRFINRCHHICFC